MYKINHTEKSLWRIIFFIFVHTQNVEKPAAIFHRMEKLEKFA